MVVVPFCLNSMVVSFPWSLFFLCARSDFIKSPFKGRSTTEVFERVATSLHHAESSITIKFTQNSQILFGPDHDRKTAEVSSRSRIFGTINYWWHSGRQLLHWTWLLSLCLSPVPFLGRRIIHSSPMHSSMVPIVLDRWCLWKNKASPFRLSSLPFFLSLSFGIDIVLTFFLFLSSVSCCLVSLSRSFSSWSSKRITPPVIKLTKPTEMVSKDPRNNVSDRPKVWTQNSCVIKDGPRETTRLDKKRPTRRWKTRFIDYTGIHCN